MQFVSVRDLRGKPRKVWQALRKDRELVITSNGKPIGILSHTNEAEFEETLAAVRKAKAQQALASMWRASARLGNDKLKMADIDHIVADVRRKRRK